MEIVVKIIEYSSKIKIDSMVVEGLYTMKLILCVMGNRQLVAKGLK